jgi:hypothetical protein
MYISNFGYPDLTRPMWWWYLGINGGHSSLCRLQLSRGMRHYMTTAVQISKLLWLVSRIYMKCVGLSLCFKYGRTQIETRNNYKQRVYTLFIYFYNSHYYRTELSYIVYIMRDIFPCSLLKLSRSFGEICRLYLHGRISRLEAGGKQAVFTQVSCCAYYELKMEAICSLKRQLTLNGLHGAISQKIVLFITAAVRTLNTTWIIFAQHGVIIILVWCNVSNLINWKLQIRSCSTTPNNTSICLIEWI